MWMGIMMDTVETVVDLLLTLEAWGRDGDCPTDFTGDGQTGFDDLVVIA